MPSFKPSFIILQIMPSACGDTRVNLAGPLSSVLGLDYLECARPSLLLHSHVPHAYGQKYTVPLCPTYFFICI